MWWNKEVKDTEEKSTNLPYSIDAIIPSIKNSYRVIRSESAVRGTLIASETGRQALQDLADRLQLKFPVEIIYRPDKWDHSFHNTGYPMKMRLRKAGKGGFILTLKHQAEYGPKATLDGAIMFLIDAKMIETAFPGILIWESLEKKNHFPKARDILAEIAYRIKEPHFPGGDTPYFGRVHPYPVFRCHDPIGLFHVYNSLRLFYEQELLARTYPNYGFGGERYEFALLHALFSCLGRSNLTVGWLMNLVTTVAAESKLGYGQKFPHLSASVSERLAELVHTHGANLFLEALEHRCGKDIVQTAYSIIDQLPLEGGNGFGPPLLHDIYKVTNELYTFFSRGKRMKVDEIDRLGIGITLRGECGGLRGEVKIENGPTIAFLRR